MKEKEMVGQRSFLNFIRELRNGATEEELGASLTALVAEVQATELAGSLVFTVKIAPNKGIDGMVFITDEIKINSPKRHRSSSLFYVDDNKNLVRNDPRQMNLDDLVRLNQSPKKEVPLERQ